MSCAECTEITYQCIPAQMFLSEERSRAAACKHVGISFCFAWFLFLGSAKVELFAFHFVFSDWIDVYKVLMGSYAYICDIILHGTRPVESPPSTSSRERERESSDKLNIDEGLFWPNSMKYDKVPYLSCV